MESLYKISLERREHAAVLRESKFSFIKLKTKDSFDLMVAAENKYNDYCKKINSTFRNTRYFKYKFNGHLQK